VQVQDNKIVAYKILKVTFVLEDTVQNCDALNDIEVSQHPARQKHVLHFEFVPSEIAKSNDDKSTVFVET
jgi:hypothetical protein